MNGPKMRRGGEWIIAQGDAQGSLGTGWKPILLFNPGNLPPAATRLERAQLEFGCSGRVFSSQDGHALATFSLRPETPRELDFGSACGPKGIGNLAQASAHARQLKGSARVPPLKGGQNSAQGFNPGLGVLMRCALKGHQNGHAASSSYLRKHSVILSPLSGRILGCRVPRVETLG